MYDDEMMTKSNPEIRHFGIEQTVFILLILLSLVGIFVTDFNPDDGYNYWIFMVIIFGMLSIFVSWLHAKSSDVSFADAFKAQGMHWLHTIIVVIAATLLNKSGQLTGVSADLVILLILGLSTMLSGFHGGWEFSLLGFFLVGCAVIIGYVQAFMWSCVALAVVIVSASFVRAFWFHAAE
ncbi:MAG: hypothetical protein CTY29_08150 [Methylobacter sp.]|nr:MAG: hypothetical protein CTY29_08150 [Methylobacter sp.]